MWFPQAHTGPCLVVCRGVCPVGTITRKSWIFGRARLTRTASFAQFFVRDHVQVPLVDTLFLVWSIILETCFFVLASGKEVETNWLDIFECNLWGPKMFKRKKMVGCFLGCLPNCPWGACTFFSVLNFSREAGWYVLPIPTHSSLPTPWGVIWIGDDGQRINTVKFNVSRRRRVILKSSSWRIGKPHSLFFWG